ncbi:MAG: ribosome maturation factor RimM [Solobacterium sp.]|nr:ribosome maturation factor RimM [Solobacterium sp.]
MEDYICIGRIVNTHGLKGEVKIQSYSDFDAQRYKKGNHVYILHEGKYNDLTVETFRSHKGFSLVKFHEIQGINQAEEYRNDELYIQEKDRKKLGKGQYYRSELEGLKIIDEEGNVLGTCLGVEETKGAQNNLRLQKADGSSVLVPYVPAFIQEVNTQEGYIRIHVIEGLL